MKTDTTISKYALAYSNYYDLLNNTLLADAPNYWQAGCIFDTVLDFLALSITSPLDDNEDVTISKAEAQKAVHDVLKKYNCDIIFNQNKTQHVPANVYYNGTSEIPGIAQCANWYDDAGWWGIACAKVYDPSYKELFTSETKAKAEKIAKACWTAMETGTYTQYGGAPNVYQTAINQNSPYVDQAAPRYQGGVWQSNFGDPLTASLGPFQNSVVNGLWFTLSTRLYKMSGDFELQKRISPYIESFSSFFKQWMADSEYSILFKTGEQSGLIRERYPAYNNSVIQHGGNILVNPSSWFEANTCWAGDQGLYLGGFYEYSTIMLSEQSFANEAMNLILGGIPNMTTTNPITPIQGNVIAPWFPYTSDNGLKVTDSSDYASGSGICMRYLLYGYLKGGNPISERLSQTNDPLCELIHASAEACVNNTYPQFGNTSFDQFNSLSILMLSLVLKIKQ
ncbi:hypothetical protein [uncultured Tenacibaculum sp.]|uniref:hypothetical protein n=1 Tax=uncultured Tenacibaculum sp. TaxID=174713 RepID=UPI00261A203C|nr:hypothetical protein [uncultured Tenacibaculum sp.]